MRYKSILFTLIIVFFAKIGSTVCENNHQEQIYLLNGFDFSNGKWTLNIPLIGKEQIKFLEDKLKKHKPNVKLKSSFTLNNVNHLEYVKRLLKGRRVRWQETTCDLVLHLYEDKKLVWFAQVLFYDNYIVLQTENKAKNELYGVQMPYSALDFLKYAM